MKKIRILSIVAMVGLVMAGCAKDSSSFGRFFIESPSFDDNGEKVVLSYSASLSKLLYENGDVISVNGSNFTLSEGATYWTATSVSGNPAEAVNNKFYVAYADNGTLTNFTSGNYTFNILSKVDVQPSSPTNPNSNSTNGVVLAGATSDSLVHLYPACAILRMAGGSSFSYVKVGFEANKVPVKGTLQAGASSASITSVENYLEGVTVGGDGKFLYMTKCNDGWYVAVPVTGSGISSTLYFEWNTGSETVKYKTQGQVEMRKGYVYSVGSAAPPTPFNTDGSTKSVFEISDEDDYIRFSSGNLQYQPGTIGDGSDDKWRFADHQYTVIGDNNSNIGLGYTTGWIDLFGWGTSGWNSGANSYRPYSKATQANKYLPGSDANNDLTGSYANADWGVYHSPNNPGFIYQGVLVTTREWRTLTEAEWNYLLTGRSNAANKRGLATVGSTKGLILLPESWSLPAGISFDPTASDFTTNTYSLNDWDALEMAGAVFLPMSGYRSGTVVNDLTVGGYYWSTTHKNSLQSYVMKFQSGSITTEGANRANGCAVRLVRNAVI